MSVRDDGPHMDGLSAEVNGFTYDDMVAISDTAYQQGITARESLPYDKAHDAEKLTKPQIHRIPKSAIYAMAGALTYGANKYKTPPGPWKGDRFAGTRQGCPFSHIDSALRHILDHLNGQLTDTESGCLSLGCAMAQLAIAHEITTNPPKEQ